MVLENGTIFFFSNKKAWYWPSRPEPVPFPSIPDEALLSVLMAALQAFFPPVPPLGLPCFFLRDCVRNRFAAVFPRVSAEFLCRPSWRPVLY